MNTPPQYPAPPKRAGRPTNTAIITGVVIGATILVIMLFISWFGLAGYTGKGHEMLKRGTIILNLPAFMIVLGGAKGRTGDYYILAFLIFFQWLVISSIVGFVVYLVARSAQRRT